MGRYRRYLIILAERRISAVVTIICVSSRGLVFLLAG